MMNNSRSSSFSRRSPELVSSYISIPEDVNTFEFDACFIDELFILKNIAGYIFKKTLFQSKFEIDEIILTNFISDVCQNYKQNHFHNFQHAVNILHMTYMLLDKTNIIHKLNPHIVFAILISALSHDVDHPGNTNSYEINSMSKYSILYNDISVLENHHCTLTFQLLEKSGLSKCINQNQFREFRKTIIACILGTDMTKHNECINKFIAFDFEKTEYSFDDQVFIGSSFVHFADLSNPLKNFDISFEWSKRISREFYEQTIKEEIEGLPSHSFMKIHDNVTMCLNEIQFITLVSMPIWSAVASKFENLKILNEKLIITLEKWRDYQNHYLEENNINYF